MSHRAAGWRVVHGVLDQVADDVVDLGGVEGHRGDGWGRPRPTPACCFSAMSGSRSSTTPSSSARRSVGTRSSCSCLASSRASLSRSATSRSIRAAWRWMISQETLPGLGVVGVVEQGLGVALDGGERRAQLVRDVGDEVAADLVGALEIGDVVEHQDRRRGRWRRPAPAGRPGRAALSRVTASSKASGRAAGQHLAELLGDARVADRLDVQAARRRCSRRGACGAPPR